MRFSVFDAREVAGSATYKQSKTENGYCPYKVGLFILSSKWRKFVYLVCLKKKKKNSQWRFFSPDQNYFPKKYIVHL